MSNYLIAFGTTDTVQEVHDFFSGKSENDSELSVVKLDEKYVMLSLSKSESIQKFGHTTRFFKGWFQDHDSESIILGEKGFLKWLSENEDCKEKEHEGTYISANFDNGRFCVRNDLFSYLPVIHFTEKDLFVCSDSLFIISELRKGLGIPCELNKEVMYSRSWTHGLACALMSNQTQIKGVQILSPGKYIEIDVSESKSQFHEGNHHGNNVISANLRDYFSNDFESYTKGIRNATNDFVRTVTEFLQLEEVLITFGLSGGLDSRIILAALMHKPELMNRVSISSNPHPSRKSDYDIVSRLSEEFGFEFNNSKKLASHQDKFNIEKQTIEDRYALWVLSFMGVFDMMYLRDSYWPTPSIIEMGGHGAETIKATFAKKDFSSLFPITRKSILQFYKVFEKRHKKKRIKHEMSNGLKSSGIDLNDSDSLQWHHLCYKSPIQNGRYIDHSMIAIRPFIQKSLFSLAISKLNPFMNAGPEEPTILHDMLILLNPELAMHEFENSKTNLSKEYVQSRLKKLGGKLQLSNSKPYSIHGAISDIKNGPPDIFLRMVKHDFNKDGSVSDSIIKSLEKSWENISDKELKKVYLSAYELALQRLNEEGNYPPNSGTPAAKIISLNLTTENGNHSKP